MLPEGASRLLGRDAQRTNIAVGMAVANAVKSTLGPKGMDKMLVSDLGDIVVTNDGATILEEMNVEHPVAKIMVEVAKTQDKEVGDGTTSVVIIAGELLKGAGELIEQGVHPTIIIRGYKMAADKSIELIGQKVEKLDVNDDATLKKIAVVTIGSKNVGDEHTKGKLSELVINAVKQVMERRDGKISVDHDFIKVEKKSGGSIEDTQLIRGVLIDKEVTHPGMPKSIKNAKIALLDAALEIEKTETDARIEITSPEQMQSFLKQEEHILKDMVDKIAASGANVVFAQKGIDDMAQHFLAKRGVMAVRRVKKSDMEKLGRATQGKLITSLEDLSATDLGFAGLVEERKIAGEQMVFVEECKDPKSVTLFIRGGTQQVVDELERAITDVIGAISSVLETGAYVFGGGAIQVELASGLRKYAESVSGREQLAILKYADALEIVPMTLAENCGADRISTLMELRNRHSTKEGYSYGVDVNNNTTGEMKKLGVYEPSKVVSQAIKSATEASVLVIGIDDVISSKSKGPAGGGAGGMPPGGEMD